jgi:guanosine-3',5'-bis(diphosphate) 3'-pyrophosphohydrolase
MPEPGAVGNTLGQMSDAVKRVFFGKGSDSLQVEGQDDLLVYRARCCNPIRGEEIIGYVTRGKGVAVHARSCPNVQNLLYESDRRIEVDWAALAPHRPNRSWGPQADDLSREADRPLRRPCRPAERVHSHHLRRRHQHPLTSTPNPRWTAWSSSTSSIETVDVRHLNAARTLNLRKVPGVREVHRVQKI